jgi:hypothetical protein
LGWKEASGSNIKKAVKSSLLGKVKSGGSQFKASLGKQFTTPHLQNNQRKIDWRRGSSHRVASTDFKP